MKKQIWLGAMLLFLMTLVLAACGTDGDETGDKENDGGTSDGNTSGEVEPMIEQLDDDTYRYIIVNETEETLTFNYTSGQRFDYSLENENGEQVFLFSSVTSFLQALGEETAGPGENLSYEFDIPELDLEAGMYKLEVWLTPKEGPAYHTDTEYIVE